MSEHLLKFLVSELAVVRITCPKCQTTVELPVADVPRKFPEAQCLCCHEYMQASGSNNLNKLANAIEGLKVSPTVKVEFVLPGDGK